MQTNRRSFVKAAAVLGMGAAFTPHTQAAERPSSFITAKPKMKLGTVTYNLAKDWDVPTIIKNCSEAKFEGVELRTSHKHGVEVTLSQTQRAEVKKRFAERV
jgi:hypothetical protein